MVHRAAARPTGDGRRLVDPTAHRHTSRIAAARVAFARVSAESRVVVARVAAVACHVGDLTGARVVAVRVVTAPGITRRVVAAPGITRRVVAADVAVVRGAGASLLVPHAFVRR